MENFKHHTQNENGTVTFCFYKVTRLIGRQYLVIASELSTKFRLFYMEEEEGKWKIMQPEKLSSWILQMEEELSDNILQNSEEIPV